MDAIERSVVCPQIEITVDRALGRQILRDRAPLATGREYIHQAVHDRAHLDLALSTAPPGWWDQWFDERPFRVRDIARIAQFAAIVSSTIFIRPHRRPRENQVASLNHKRFIRFNLSSDRHLETDAFQVAAEGQENPDEVTLSVAFANLAGKPIRAFEGTLKFTTSWIKRFTVQKLP